MRKWPLEKQQGNLGLLVEIEEGTVGSALARIHEARDSLTTKDVGDWFELIVLRLLQADPEFEVADAWLGRDCPPEIGGGEDLGTDIVARTADGRIIAVQCKYRSGGEIAKGDINSFLADAATKANYDLLFVATSADLGRNAKKAIKGIDKPCQHIDVRKWASVSLDAGKKQESRKPNKQQATAIRNVLKGLGDGGLHNRGKLIMACGTGKTFTSLRIAEGIKDAHENPLFLFAAPSIALVGQARREWLAHAAEKLSTLVVCSSQAEGRAPVQKDGPVDMDPSELSCQVTTDPVAIAEFMKGDGMPRAVFCTYHSLHQVAAAQAENGAPSFDLAIADEAHRTTGKFDEGKTDFRLFLKEDDLKARKRLFMTATPRVYTDSSKTSVGFTVVDMRDENLYGDTLHVLTFREAVEAELLCDYRVIVLALNNHMNISEAVRQAFEEARDEANAGEDDISPADQVRLFGTCLAINGAVSGEGVETPKSLPRTLAFANNVKVSKWMAKAIGDKRTIGLAARRLRGEGRKAQQIQAAHLDAQTGGNKRLAEVRALQTTRDGACRMICNVGLFGEGVDIPALDGVVFFQPRRSPIEVMQAVGRVMRKSPRKKMGYVIVPVVVPPKTNVIEALKESDDGFEKVGEVLRALQSQDPSLVDKQSDYVHIVQPNPPNGADGTNGDGGVGPQGEFRFDLSGAVDKAALYAFIGDAAGFRGRKDLVAGHMKLAVDAYKDKLDGMGLASSMARALGLPHSDENEKGNACAIASLLLINAMLLGHRLGRDVEGVDEYAIRSLVTERRPYSPCRRTWLYILKRDYAPIFRPALAALDVIGGGPNAALLIRGIASAALDVAGAISDFSYDHSGPLFHKVLGKRGEADGAFYSNNLAALLLAGLALPKHPGRSIRVLDPACGTGTLLLAVLDTLKRHALRDQPSLDEAALHRKLVEESVHGIDINHHAAQFAAANLTLGAPDVGFRRMNLAAVRDGVHDGTPYAGSLELLPSAQQQLVLRDIQAPLPPIEGLPDAAASASFDPVGMDLIITNPPYTGINKRLKKLPEKRDRELMRDRLKLLYEGVGQHDADSKGVLRGSRTMGPPFVVLAHHLLRRDSGTLAMVKPVTALTAPSATAVAERRYLAKRFHLDITVTSHAKADVSKGLSINFSEDTNIHEALLVLRRWPDGKAKPMTRVVSLHRQPTTKADALALLDAIQTGGELREWGLQSEWPAERIEAGDWSYANWHDGDLADQALRLRRMDGLVDLATCVNTPGSNPDNSKFYEVVDVGQEHNFPCYNTTSQDVMRTMKSNAPAGALLKTGLTSNMRRGLKPPSRFLFSFRADPSTARILAFHAPAPSVSTQAFHSLRAKGGGDGYEQALVAFLNSTAGWLQVLNQRSRKLTYTRILPNSVGRLKVPPPASHAIPALSQAFQRLANKELAMGRDSADCPVRSELDGVVAKGLGMSDEWLHEIRRRIANEPTVSRGSRPPTT